MCKYLYEYDIYIQKNEQISSIFHSVDAISEAKPKQSTSVTNGALCVLYLREELSPYVWTLYHCHTEIRFVINRYKRGFHTNR